MSRFLQKGLRTNQTLLLYMIRHFNLLWCPTEPPWFFPNRKEAGIPLPHKLITAALVKIGERTHVWVENGESAPSRALARPPACSPRACSIRVSPGAGVRAAAEWEPPPSHDPLQP